MSTQIRFCVVLLLGLATLSAIGFAIHLSLDPERYFRYPHMDYPEWSHPTRHVAFVGFIMLLEGVLAGIILVGPWPKRYWLRSIIGAPPFIIWGQLSTLWVVHMPGYVLFHHLWIWVLSFFVSGTVMVVLAVQGASKLLNARKNTNHGTR